ncbi:MAG: MFS transporter, partial [Gammaproteobacteria bacterium]|nr:MFS transporter [Gammaproteobacteria bacterium]
TFMRAWLIWVIGAIFYSYEFFLRISPGVMTSDLMASFSIDATAVGLLSGFYYYAYASMQIPVGILLDTFGIRRLLASAALMVAGGCWLFAASHVFWQAELGRVLMGIGSAFSFIGVLKLVTNWFSEKYLAMVIGFTNTLGVVGAIGGEAPLAQLVNHLGWRQTLLTAAAIGVAIAVLVYLIIRDYPKNPPTNVRRDHAPAKHFWSGLLHVLKSPRAWLVGAVGGLMVAPVSAFTELWSVPFLGLAHHISRTEAALIASFMFIGIAVGGPTHGYLSGLLGRRKPVIWLGALGALLCLSAVIYLSIPNVEILCAILFVFGFCTSSMLLCFAINSESQPTWATGVAVGFTNMLVMMGGTIFQPLVGHVLDDRWQGQLLANVRVYTVTDYRMALSLLPCCLIIALIIIPLMRETYCVCVGDKG